MCVKHFTKCLLCKQFFCNDCYPFHRITPECGCKIHQCRKAAGVCYYCKSTSKTHLKVAFKKASYSADKCYSQRIDICCLCQRYYRDIISSSAIHSFCHYLCHCGADVCKDSTATCDVCSHYLSHGKWELGADLFFTTKSGTDIRNFVNICCICEVRTDIMVQTIFHCDKEIILFLKM
ncbi:MAG: hypothetical protein Hyperionvirus7_33 [Hyperionvirus sp.]|uniref:RING-type domain-containing protein n=1 Tax=Hyperionvirus sp. TaxID=2487770 RepID=A0A3G5A8R8_9VIRU|nr:MAG: hypothetical protein Hyperionvirus7_33 [Hyperionvirus sp.]